MKKYELYCVDVESTGFDPISQDIIEISICRLSNNEQKTWCMHPLNKETISPEALRVNGHKIEDILHQTPVGKEKYLDPKKIVVDIENWLMEDFMSSEERIVLGQNAQFDINFMKELWKKCNSSETYPFNKRYSMDTMQIALITDYIDNTMSEGYSLYALTKKYAIKNDKAHSAAADVRATKQLFEAQVNYLKNRKNDR